MNEIRVARIAFAAYLLSSALGAIHHHDRRAGSGEGRVELEHQPLRARVFDANHDAVGLQKIFDRRALLEKLWIADDAEGMRGFAPDHFPDSRCSADRHGALVDDDLVAVHRLGDLARDTEHVRQVGRTVLMLRCANRNEHNRRVANRFRKISGELETLFRSIAADHLLEAGLVDGHDAAAKLPNLGLVLVDTDDVVSRFRETGSEHQADIARADDRNFHP